MAFMRSGLLPEMNNAGKWLRRTWPYAVVATAIICLGTCVYVLSWPWYSQTLHKNLDPGGPSGSVFLGILFWVLIPTLVLPSFPALFLLSFFPPKSYGRKQRLSLTVAIVMFVLILATLTLVKFQLYMADYRADRSKPTPTPFERFEYLRKTPNGNANEAR